MELLLEAARHVLGMAWSIAWGLVLGFGISAVVQNTVRREAVAEHLGEARPGPLALATALGAASSSCSYAAAEMSKTLFRKGAHPANATAFLFASTNLVVEIGLVIWMLLGWRFVLAELAGGIVLIVLAALLVSRAPRRWVEAARRHGSEGDASHGGGGTLAARALLTREGIGRVGRTFRGDWRMVGRDIALGVLIAGVVAAWVPAEAWQGLFRAPGSGGTGSVWVSVLVGPLIAILAFVCSVGNIPLAAVLWSNGMAFAGVVAFIFADLVTLPMVWVYRRYYGFGPALAYAACLLVAIVAAALGVSTLFDLAGLAPQSGAATGAERDYFAWDYTTWLNLLFLPLAALGVRAARWTDGAA